MKTSVRSATVAALYRLRWRIWIVAVMAHTIGLFHRSALAPMADRIMADFQISAAVFGGLGAVYFYIYAAMQLPSGTLADTLGPRKTITLGLLTSTTGALIMGLSPSFVGVYIGRIIISFGVSVVWLSAIKITMVWFRPRATGTMLGISGAIVNVGQLAAATPLALLVIWIGWHWSLVAIGIVGLALAVTVWLTVRDSPAQAGLPTLSALETGEGSDAAVPRASGQVNYHDPPSLSLAQRLGIVFRNKTLWTLLLVGFGMHGAYSALFQNWGVVYIMQSYEVHRDFASNFMMMSTIGSIVSSPLIGYMSDRMRKRRLPMLLWGAITTASFIVVALWNGGRPPIPALYILCFLTGFGPASLSLSLAYVRDTVRPDVRGLGTGLVNSGAFLGGAAAQPLFGVILDRGWQGQMVEGARAYPLAAFQQGLLLCAGLVLVGFIGSLMLRETNCQDTWKDKTAQNKSS